MDAILKEREKGRMGNIHPLPIGMMIRYQGFNEEARNTTLKSLH
jgi:hypothetical protein